MDSPVRPPVDRRRREIHDGSGAAFRLKGGLDLGEGLTLYSQPDGYRVAQEDVLVPGVFATPLDAFVAALPWSGTARLGPMPEIRVPLPGGAVLVLTPTACGLTAPDNDCPTVDLRGLVEREEA